MDGVSFIVRLRKDLGFAKMPVIMISMETNAEKIAEAKRTGADEFLVKPVAKDKLEQCLKTLGVIGVVGSSTPVPPPGRVSSRLRRVMVVDDSVVIRRTLTKVLDEDPDIEVVLRPPTAESHCSRLLSSVPDVVCWMSRCRIMNGLGDAEGIEEAVSENCQSLCSAR